MFDKADECERRIIEVLVEGRDWLGDHPDWAGWYQAIDRGAFEPGAFDDKEGRA